MSAKRNRPGQQRDRTPISTKVDVDVFSDARDMRQRRFSVEGEEVLEQLWDVNPQLSDILEKAETLEQARSGLYDYLESLERAGFAVDSRLHVLENAIVRDAVGAFRSLIGPVNEKRTGYSALDCLWKLARERRAELAWGVNVSFLMEMLHLFRAVSGKAGVYSPDAVGRQVPDFLRLSGRQAARHRSEQLDAMAERMQRYLARYPSGLEPEVVARRAENRARILEYYGAGEQDWQDYRWHLRNVIKKPEPLLDLVQISRERRQALRKAVEARLPIGITPYYLGLMDRERGLRLDHAVRAQVIPPSDYVEAMAANRDDRESVFDFMGEHDTSPIGLVTRRYPLICILKPFNTCAQICVYCQRNWEIDECMAPDARAGKRELDRALAWIEQHAGVGDVLITGGDPMILADEQLERILERLAAAEHVYRIRIGTRTPVVLPMRWSEATADLLARYHQPGLREVAVVTHFEHSYEITPEAMQAVQLIRRRGMGVYNQQVFTIENSRRFETVKLRKDLRSIGVDPYYTFNMKGKEETRRLMVPIARLLQERREEARLLPGLDRTDEPVFNVPRLGKNQLQAMQDHRLVMIKPDGARIYEFHPWEKNIVPMPPYNYTDVPVHEYLLELAARGESIEDYKTIWYYY